MPGALEAREQLKASHRKLRKNELQELCMEKLIESCSGTKAELSEKLLAHAALSMAPRLPTSGAQLCHSGLAVGYDLAMRNPAWVLYRLRAEEQREADNARKGFVSDPLLDAAGVQQTLDANYKNSGYDRGHLAPSRAMSFRRVDLLKKKTGKLGPWESCYLFSNVAPQAVRTNRNAWEAMEAILHEYAGKEGHAEQHDVFVITGVGYWNRAAMSGTSLGLVVPNFFWQVACDPEAGGSFAIIAENDADMDEPWNGWPPSIFKFYSAANVEAFFDIELRLPAVCQPEVITTFLGSEAWPPSTKSRPAFQALRVTVLGQEHVAFGETVSLRLVLPFASDLVQGPGLLRIKSPQPQSQYASLPAHLAHFTFDCSALVPEKLQKFPAGWRCSDDSEGEVSFHWPGPVKGGPFVLDVPVTAPRFQPEGTNWTASLEQNGCVLSDLTGTGFQLIVRADGHISGKSWLVWGLPLELLMLALVGIVLCRVGSCWGKWRAKRAIARAGAASTLPPPKAQLLELAPEHWGPNRA